MTGILFIISMWWAAEGSDVIIIDYYKERVNLVKGVWRELSLVATFVSHNEYTPLPFENGLFDMGWDFTALWFVPKFKRFLSELGRVTREVIFICVSNTTNSFHLFRLRF